MNNKLVAAFVTILMSFTLSVAAQSTAHAADARNFNAGRIIEDNVFTDSNSMSVQAIQSFLESKVSCDTWGSKTSELGGGTRAQWMAARGISPPFRCLTDYRENVSTGQNNYGKNDTPAGAIGAAEIIYNYSRQFNINPQVILVTLQKENSMVTDEWPTPKQFSEAMGFGCPDNVAAGAPACDPQYGSFAAQIYQAARHFRGYIDNKPGWWVPFNTGWNSIAWSPNGSCGRGDVYIENRATVALYSYTPYQPNQAAKNAQYGMGDGCSAYGNRNFYLFFTDWFSGQYSYTAEKQAIATRYNAISGTLGASVGSVYCYTSNGDRWCVQRYENGYILSGKYGAWESYGNIRTRWEALDFERGVLGYPRDEVYCYTKSGDQWCVQRYEKGYIISGKYGTWESYGDIRTRWASLGYENGALGYPRGPVEMVGDTLSQKFEGGSITFNTKTKAIKVDYS